MPSLTEVRDAAVTLLQTVFPDLPRVEAFSGEITIGAVADKRLPAGVSVLVASLAADNDAAPGSLDFDVVASFGVLIISSNAAGAEYAEADALSVAETAALSIHGATFGLPVSPARVKSLEAVNDETFVENGYSVWTIVWQQQPIFTERNTDESV